MDILKIACVDNSVLCISINLCAIATVVCLIVVIIGGCYWFYNSKMLKTLQIPEIKIGLGAGTSITVKYDKKIQQIAYRMWIELQTRKIGLKIDEENDVIHEVYNSWYAAFGVIRELLKEIPPERLKDASPLTTLTVRVLNDGLRPHLTKWQAKYRAWYDCERQLSTNANESPQVIQRRFPEYDELIADMKKTNDIMINFADALKKIAYDESNNRAK